MACQKTIKQGSRVYGRGSLSFLSGGANQAKSKRIKPNQTKSNQIKPTFEGAEAGFDVEIIHNERVTGELSSFRMERRLASGRRGMTLCKSLNRNRRKGQSRLVKALKYGDAVERVPTGIQGESNLIKVNQTGSKRIGRSGLGTTNIQHRTPNIES